MNNPLELTDGGHEKGADPVEMVNIYERELAETTFDGVSELLGNFDALFDAVKKIKSDVEEIKRCWE